MIENNVQQIQEEKKYIFKDINSILFNREETAGITLLSNVNLNYTKFNTHELKEFWEIFYIDIEKNEYVYKKNQIIRYDKDKVETAILAITSFLENKTSRFSKVINSCDAKIYVPVDEEAPLIIAFDNFYNSWCLLIAPRVADA